MKTRKQRKKIILKEWKRSDGKRITEMLKRHWKLMKEEEEIKSAKKVFKELL